MPRASAAARLAWLSYPLSVIAMRGRMSGPMSSDVSNCVLSLASPPVRWKSSGLPSRSVLERFRVNRNRTGLANRVTDGIRRSLVELTGDEDDVAARHGLFARPSRSCVGLL